MVPGAQAFAAIMTSARTYTDVRVPALVLFALPHVPDSWIGTVTDPAVREAARAYYAAIDAATERQAKALEESVPTARVVRIRGAHHIFLSKEPETLREMRAFLAGLK